MDRLNNSPVLVSETPVPLANFDAYIVSYVLDIIGVDNRNHVESHHNPADLASRGLTAKEGHYMATWRA